MDARFFLDMMHGTVSAGVGGSFMKRLEKEDVVSMAVAADFSCVQVLRFIERTDPKRRLRNVL